MERAPSLREQGFYMLVLKRHFGTIFVFCAKRVFGIANLSFGVLLNKRLTPFRSFLCPAGRALRGSVATLLKITPTRGLSTLRTPPAAGAYPCSCNRLRSVARERYLWFPRIWQLTFCESGTAGEIRLYGALADVQFFIYYLLSILSSLFF